MILDHTRETSKKYKCLKIFCIQETKHCLTDADSSTITKQIRLVKQNLQKKKKKILHSDFIPFMSKSFKSETISFHYFFPRILKRFTLEAAHYTHSRDYNREKIRLLITLNTGDWHVFSKGGEAGREEGNRRTKSTSYSKNTMYLGCALVHLIFLAGTSKK